MKKNYFYANLNEQFSLLESAVLVLEKEEVSRLYKVCCERQKALCRHLLRDFITPVARENIYAISAAILNVFPLLSQASWGSAEEKKMLEQSVLLLSADPFRFDESALRRIESLHAIWGDLSFCSEPARLCFSALDNIAEALLLTAIENA